MKRNSLIATGALAVGIGLGALSGPILGNSVASAQTQAVAPSGSLWSQFLDQLATSLNIQRSALDSAIVSAGTTSVNAAVTQGTVTQAQADALNARLQAGDTAALLAGEGKGRISAVRQAMLDAAAKALSLTSADLSTQLRSGQTLAQLATAHNTTEQAVVSAALTAAKAQLDQQVTAGTITQAQADATYAQLQQQGVSVFAGRGRGAGNRGAAAPATTPAATATAGA